LSWFQTILEIITTLVKTYGYAGIFAAMAITSASILFPIPGYLTVILAAPFLNPYLVALVAGLGAAIGELTGYLLGLGGRKMIHKESQLEAAKAIYSRYGIWTIFIFAATPFPFDIIGIVCGALKVDLRIFFTFTLMGKVTLYMLLAETGYQFVGTIDDILKGQFNPSTIVVLLIALLSIIIPLLYWTSVVNRGSLNKKSIEEKDEPSNKKIYR
jgi:membrane protein YqaA with SNARE-associated domain